jgi:hypothetical protein
MKLYTYFASNLSVSLGGKIENPVDQELLILTFVLTRQRLEECVEWVMFDCNSGAKIRITLTA